MTTLRDRSDWSFGLARELPGPVPEFSVASFVDNAAALSILVNGSSSVIQGDCVGLSRGQLDGPEKVES